MPHPRIKICGLRDPAMARVAIEAGADFVGLVFVKKSPRHVDVQTAKAIAAAVGDDAKTVGLFVDEPIEYVRNVAEQVGLNAIQLHGQETEEYASNLTPYNIIKAIAARPTRIFQDVQPWLDNPLPNLTAILLDAMTQTDELPGGTGRSFYWEEFALDPALKRVSNQIMLAGGLTLKNITKAIHIVRPWAVDVSSGVESSRGVKDAAMIRDFCDAVRGKPRRDDVGFSR